MDALAEFSASFAHWRWQTLYNACVDVFALSFLRPRWAHVLASIFKDLTEQNRARLKDVTAVFNDALWWTKLRFVKRFTKFTEIRRKWGTGCQCHEEQLKLHQVIKCNFKGRRANEVWGYIMNSKFEIAAECDSFSAAMFDGVGSLVTEAARVYHYLGALMPEKLAMYNQLPLLFGRCHEPGIAARCIAIYDHLPEEKQHPRNHDFASPTKPGSMRACMLARAQGGPMDPGLEIERLAIAQLRIAGEILETPHRTIRREKVRATLAKVPWISASANLEANLKEYAAFKNHPLGPRAWAAFWNSYKMLLQPPLGKRGQAKKFAAVMRPVRMPLGEFRKKMYRLGRWSLTECSGCAWGDCVSIYVCVCLHCGVQLLPYVVHCYSFLLKLCLTWFAQSLNKYKADSKAHLTNSFIITWVVGRQQARCRWEKRLVENADWLHQVGPAEGCVLQLPRRFAGSRVLPK